VEIDYINETIRVGAVFETTGKIRPAVIVYRGRRINVNRINYTWDSRDGNVTHYHFAVDTEEGIYEISMDNKEFIWRVRKAYVV
jgi:hypothetical protein